MFLLKLLRKIRNKIMSVDKLKVTRIRNVKLPTRATPGSAGIDIYMPCDLTKVDIAKTMEITNCQPRIDYDFNTGYVKNFMVGPGDGVIIQSGIKVNVPAGYVLKVENKSSVASVKSLVVGACIIDSDYQGEVLINFHNVSKNKIAVFNGGDKIAQLVLYPVETPVVEEIDTVGELYKDKVSERGEGGFGSTGIN